MNFINHDSFIFLENLYGNQSANRFKTYCVLYVDTERNLSEQLPFALQHILRKAGHRIESDVPNFDCISLLEIEREKRFATLNRYLSESARQHHTQHIFIVLDVATDCVVDFNNPKDSLQFIDMMNRTINTHDVTFLCLIHENPNGEKARGHLGTELMNKSSTVIHVGFEKDSNNDDTNVLHIKFLKCRSTAWHKHSASRVSITQGDALCTKFARRKARCATPLSRPELVSETMELRKAFAGRGA